MLKRMNIYMSDNKFVIVSLYKFQHLTSCLILPNPGWMSKDNVLYGSRQILFQLQLDQFLRGPEIYIKGALRQQLCLFLLRLQFLMMDIKRFLMIVKTLISLASKIREFNRSGDHPIISTHLSPPCFHTCIWGIRTKKILVEE